MARRGKPVSAETNSAQPDSANRSSFSKGTVSRENAEHYRWGKDCDAWYLVNDNQLGVIEEMMPPGAAEIRHRHQHAQQFFFILAGEVLMEIEGETTLVPAGSGIRVMPGARHQIRNPSSSPVRLLVISQPPSHGDRFDD